MFIKKEEEDFRKIVSFLYIVLYIIDNFIYNIFISVCLYNYICICFEFTLKQNILIPLLIQPIYIAWPILYVWGISSFYDLVGALTKIKLYEIGGAASWVFVGLSSLCGSFLSLYYFSKGHYFSFFTKNNIIGHIIHIYTILYYHGNVL